MLVPVGHIPPIVIPAKAGIQGERTSLALGLCFRKDDERRDKTVGEDRKC
jgi:hypothetical protein